MYSLEFEGINSFLIGTSRLLLEEGVKREVRNSICYELPEPYMFKIKNPYARHITIPQRSWFKTLAYAESLWIASGRNDIAYITHYLPRMKDYSDDGKTMRGGYGPRLRHFNGSIADYDVSEYRKSNYGETDQFRYVCDCFREDSNTRRAIITIGDPVKDCFESNGELKHTKDIPCTRTLHFMKDNNSDKLNLIVSMRSNDFIYGASGVNIFNYTFMQEYFASMLGLEVGYYIHIANNMHYYELHSRLVSSLASLSDVEDEGTPYNTTFRSLEQFDNLLSQLVFQETMMRLSWNDYKPYHFEDAFFDNWYSVLYRYNEKSHKNVV